MNKESRIYPLTIAQVQWQLDDLEEAFRIAGIEPTREELNKIAVDDNIFNFMQELLKLAGTQVLADMISELYKGNSALPLKASSVH
jgi:hypothetical protein